MSRPAPVEVRRNAIALLAFAADDDGAAVDGLLAMMPAEMLRCVLAWVAGDFVTAVITLECTAEPAEARTLECTAEPAEARARLAAALRARLAEAVAKLYVIGEAS